MALVEVVGLLLCFAFLADATACTQSVDCPIFPDYQWCNAGQCALCDNPLCFVVNANANATCCTFDVTQNCPSYGYSCEATFCADVCEVADKYCNNVHQCTSCSILTKTGRCDTPERDCCSGVFRGQCPENPFGCADPCADGAGFAELNLVKNTKAEAFSFPVSAYSGAAYVPILGSVYFVPFNPEGSRWEYVDSQGLIFAYDSGVVNLAPNAYREAVYDPIHYRLYLVPHGQAPRSEWHYIDQHGLVVSYQPNLSQAHAAVSGAYWGGAYQSRTRRIYFAPYAQAPEMYWHYIDLTSGSVISYRFQPGSPNQNFTTSQLQSGAFSGAVSGLGSDGDTIQFIPFNEISWRVTITDLDHQVNPTPESLVPQAYIGAAYWPFFQVSYLAPFMQAVEPVWHYVASSGSLVEYRPEISGLVPRAYAGAVYLPGKNQVMLIPFMQANESYWHYLSAPEPIDNEPVVKSYQPNEKLPGGSLAGGAYLPSTQRVYFTPSPQVESGDWYSAKTLCSCPVGTHPVGKLPYCEQVSCPGESTLMGVDATACVCMTNGYPVLLPWNATTYTWMGVCEPSSSSSSSSSSSDNDDAKIVGGVVGGVLGLVLLLLLVWLCLRNRELERKPSVEPAPQPLDAVQFHNSSR